MTWHSIIFYSPLECFAKTDNAACWTLVLSMKSMNCYQSIRNKCFYIPLGFWVTTFFFGSEQNWDSLCSKGDVYIMTNKPPAGTLWGSPHFTAILTFWQNLWIMGWHVSASLSCYHLRKKRKKTKNWNCNCNPLYISWDVDHHFHSTVSCFIIAAPMIIRWLIMCQNFGLSIFF